MPPKKDKQSQQNMAAVKSAESDDAILYCGECKQIAVNKPTKFDEESMECECCKTWFHVNCTADLKKDKFDAINKFNLHWYCQHCDRGALLLYQKCAALQAEHNSMKQDMLKLTERVNNCEKVDSTINDKLQKSDIATDHKIRESKTQIRNDVMKEVKTTISESNQRLRTDVQHQLLEEKTLMKEQIKAEILYELNARPDTTVAEATAAARVIVQEELNARPQTSVADATAAARMVIREELEDITPTREIVRAEMEERERIAVRKFNLMILNLSETNTRQTDEETEENDITRINEIINNRLHLNITVDNATRLGNRSREKYRPVRVTLRNLDEKKRILKRAVQLRYLDEGDTYYRVYIRPDLTVKQLATSKNLQEMLKQKRLDYPQKQWKIFRERIIEVEATVDNQRD